VARAPAYRSPGRFARNEPPLSVPEEVREERANRHEGPPSAVLVTDALRDALLVPRRAPQGSFGGLLVPRRAPQGSFGGLCRLTRLIGAEEVRVARAATIGP